MNISQNVSELNLKKIQEVFIMLYKDTSYDDSMSYHGASLHLPSLIKFPVFFVILYLYLNLKRNSNLFYLIILSIIIATLALCETSIFGLVILCFSLFILYEIFKKKFDKKYIISSLVIILSATTIAMLQGGLLTTKLFYSYEMSPLGSLISKFGGDVFSLKINSDFKSIVGRVIRFAFFQNYLFPIFLIVALQIKINSSNLLCSSDFKRAIRIFLIILSVGFLLSILLISPIHGSKNMGRFVLWPVGSLLCGIYVGMVLDMLKNSKLQKFILILILLTISLASLLRITAGFGLSIGYHFLGNEKKVEYKELFYGNWLKSVLPRDARLFGGKPRYTGLFSYGGNQYRDKELLPEFKRFGKAKRQIDYLFLKKYKITHIVLDGKTYSLNKDILSDTKKFVEIKGPHSDFKKLFKVQY